MGTHRVYYRPQGPEEYEFYYRESFERWQGDMVFPSAEKRGVTRPRSAKMEAERELTIKERVRARALDV